VIFVHQNLISNRLTYLVHAKSTGELISFGFSDHSVRSLFGLSDRAQLIAESKQKKRLHFLADLWSQSEFRTQRKTDPKSEMTRCKCCIYEIQTVKPSTVPEMTLKADQVIGDGTVL